MPNQTQDGRGTTRHPLPLAQTSTHFPASLFSELADALSQARRPLRVGQEEVG
jgi:hypothetical protein